MYGKNSSKKQRFKCLKCGRVYIWKTPKNKIHKEKHWFELWVKEGYSIRQISAQSGYGKTKLKLIKNYWLQQELPDLLIKNMKSIKYLLFDGTYFKKSGCFIVLTDNKTKKVCACKYVKNEGYKTGKPFFESCKEAGLNPKAITTDGNQHIIQALKEVWSGITIQRCLVHIMRENCKILRRNPPTQAARDLKKLLIDCPKIKDKNGKDAFKNRYKTWHQEYGEWFNCLEKTDQNFKDLKEVLTTINNALLNMFHFIKDKKIASSTNTMEGYFGHLKPQYERHNGLSKEHKISYLKNFCYYKNDRK